MRLFLNWILIIIQSGLVLFILSCDGDDAAGDGDAGISDNPDSGPGGDDLYPTEDLWPEVDSLVLGDSMFSFCIGTNKDFREDFKGAHGFNVQSTIDQALNFQLIKESKIEEVQYGVTNYTLADPTNVADPTQNNVICAGTLIMYDWEDYWHWYDNYDDYEDFKFNMAMLLLDRMEADMGIDFTSHIEVMEIMTPLTMQGFSLSPAGSIFGWAMTPEQSMDNRMPSQTPIDNLLLAGAWTYPGGGQSISIISGMLAGINILKKDDEPVPEHESLDPPIRGINAEVFANMGIKDELTIECSETLYNLMYLDMCAAGKECEFSVPADPEEYRVWLKERYPDDDNDIDGLFQKMYDINKVMRVIFGYDYAGKDTSDGDVMGEMLADINAAGDHLQDVLLNDIVPLMDGTTLTEFMTPYTTNMELISFFTYLAGMAGEGPDNIDAIFFIAMWTQYHLGGYCYVHGGSQAISDALAKKIRTLNKIRLNTLVTKIDIDENDLASQVRTADGTCFKTRYVISNANGPDTFFKMVGYEHLPTALPTEEEPNPFHPGLIWQPPMESTPAKPVETPNTTEIDQLTGATPLLNSARLTSDHTGWNMANCLSCHSTDAHAVAGLGNNASHYSDAECTTCHGSNGSPVASAANHQSGTVNDNCGSCHANTHAGLDYQSPDDCRACHKFNDDNADVGDVPECVVTEEGYDVVIIGAGAGGLGAGAYLSEQGYNVVVLEKHHKVGGYMTNFNRGQYRFEVSTHGFDGLDPRPYVDWNVNGGDQPDPEGKFTVSGVVKRTIPLVFDGIGTICIGVTVSCPGTGNMNPESLGSGIEIEDADLSADGVEIPYSIVIDKAEAEMGKTYAVSTVMRESGGDCSPPTPGEPTLLAGDLVAMNCGTFEYQGTDVEDVDMTLDWALEWDM